MSAEQVPPMMPAEWLAHAAVEAGEVPAEVAAWADDPETVVALDVDPERGSTLVEALPGPVGGWQITNDAAAEWALRKLAAANAELDDLDGRYRVELGRLNEWRDRSRRRPETTAAFMRDRLQSYALAQRDERDRKTVDTPAGQVRTRGPAPGKEWRVEVEDPDAVVEWALANGAEALIGPPRLASVSTIRPLVRVVEVPEVDEEGEVTTARLVVSADDEREIPGLVPVKVEPTATIHPAP